MHNQQRSPTWIGGIILFAALTLTAVVAAIYLWPSEEDNPPDVPDNEPQASPVVHIQEISPSPTISPAAMTPTAMPTVRPTATPLPVVDWVHPTAAADEIAAALADDGRPVVVENAISRDLQPLTIQPVRARSGVESYTVRQGDNLQSIAEAFGLEQSTIIWSNDRFYVNAMRVGLELTILPVDGVYHHVVESEPITTVAETYSVDPYAIIDSEFNSLFGSSPQTVLPAGLYVVVPGGEGSTEPIYWDPGVVVSTGADAAVSATYASFGTSQSGSCGSQAVQGGSPPYSPPILRSYTFTQDYSWQHGGVDLAVPVGTDIFAAGGGTVIFAGWSDWGYGYTVVIAHGSTLSLYGHLNGPLVSCGQVVAAGQGIAVSGNSGNSSGPHLHFEIRGSDGRPVSPWNYQSF